MTADRSVRLLIGYAAAVACLLALWQYCGHHYIATLVPLANGLLGIENLPVNLSLHGERMAISYLGIDGRWLHSELRGHDLACLSVLSAIALMAAMPGHALKRRLLLCGSLVAALWMTHVLSLYGGAYYAIGHYLEGVSGSHAAAGLPAIIPQEWHAFSAARARNVGRALGVWSAWGAPSLILLTWAVAFHHQTGKKRTEHLHNTDWEKQNGTRTQDRPADHARSRHAA